MRNPALDEERIVLRLEHDLNWGADLFNPSAKLRTIRVPAGKIIVACHAESPWYPGQRTLWIPHGRNEFILRTNPKAAGFIFTPKHSGLRKAKKCARPRQQKFPFALGGEACENVSETLPPPFLQSRDRAPAVLRDPAVFQESQLIGVQRIVLCDPPETVQVMRGFDVRGMSPRSVVRPVPNAAAVYPTADVVGREHLIEVDDGTQPVELKPQIDVLSALQSFVEQACGQCRVTADNYRGRMNPEKSSDRHGQ